MIELFGENIEDSDSDDIIITLSDIESDIEDN